MLLSQEFLEAGTSVGGTNAAAFGTATSSHSRLPDQMYRDFARHHLTLKVQIVQPKYKK